MEAAAAAHKQRRQYRQRDLHRTKQAATAALMRVERLGAASVTSGVRAVMGNQRRLEAEAKALKSEAETLGEQTGAVVAAQAALEASVVAIPSVAEWASGVEESLRTVALQLDELAASFKAPR